MHEGIVEGGYYISRESMGDAIVRCQGFYTFGPDAGKIGYLYFKATRHNDDGTDTWQGDCSPPSVFHELFRRATLWERILISLLNGLGHWGSDDPIYWWLKRPLWRILSWPYMLWSRITKTLDRCPCDFGRYECERFEHAGRRVEIRTCPRCVAAGIPEKYRTGRTWRVPFDVVHKDPFAFASDDDAPKSAIVATTIIAEAYRILAHFFGSGGWLDTRVSYVPLNRVGIEHYAPGASKRVVIIDGEPRMEPL